MIKTRSVNILHFEDDKGTQYIVKKALKNNYNARIKTESTLLNCESLVSTYLVNSFDVIICDYMFPTVSAEERLEVFAKCKKYVIFHTCIDLVDFQERVNKRLGYVPSNFIHCRKAQGSGTDPLIKLIDDIIA
jgi:CheY-like chemotaxis protein